MHRVRPRVTSQILGNAYFCAANENESKTKIVSGGLAVEGLRPPAGAIVYHSLMSSRGMHERHPGCPNCSARKRSMHPGANHT